MDRIFTAIEMQQCSLKRCMLGWNAISDKGAARIAEALGKYRDLVELNLAYNRIGTVGAESIAMVLADNKAKALEVLDLQRNVIGREGSAALKEAAASRQGLKLNLEGNNDWSLKDQNRP